MNIGERLKKVRKEKGETQTDIALLLQTTQHQISKYESGKHDIPAYRLAILCQHWSVSADYILGIEKTEE